jgi:hypothetical protein
VGKKKTVTETETIQEETPSPPGRKRTQGENGGKKTGILDRVGKFAGTFFDFDEDK